MKFGALAQKSIYEITPKDLTNWRNKRLSEVSENTVLRKSHTTVQCLHSRKKNCFD